MRNLLVGLTATLFVAAPLAVIAAPAEANTPCASRAEFRQIHVGQTVRKTQAIIGSRGKVTVAGSFLSQRQWRVCGSSYSWVTLTYVQGRLDNKILL